MDITEKPKTFWQKVMPWIEQPKPEVRFYNPLKVAIGSLVTLKTLELENLEFTLDSIEEYQRTLGRKVYTFTDYNLSAAPVGGDRIKVKLRANPIEGAKLEDGAVSNLVLLSLEDEMGFSPEFMGVFDEAEANKKFTVSLDGEEDGLQAGEHQDIDYFRLNDVASRYTASVSEVRDDNGDGEFQRSEITTADVEYLDFGREIELPGGYTTTEFFFVELAKETGWFSLWRGTSIDASRLTVFGNQRE